MVQEQPIAVAKPLAPEDIAPGQFVAILHEVVNTPRWAFDEGVWTLRPSPGSHAQAPEEFDVPMRVLAVCLPFVLVSCAPGGLRQVDVRRARLALLSAEYAAKAFPPATPEPGEAAASEAAPQAGSASDTPTDANSASGAKRSRRRRRFVMRL